MSTKFTFVFLLSIIGVITNAQYPCFNGISTNQLNPINNQLTSKKNTFFNWEDSLWAMQPSSFCFRTGLNESPFYKIDNLEELREAKDMRWEDGWELIRRFVGLTETNAYTASNPEHLYVVLYNKYTGILRVLLLACRGADYNAAKITLKFHGTSQMKTDLLELSREQVSALNKNFTPVVFTAASKYINENNKWFYADFPMMFDPCTCNYKSKLNIASELIATSTINIEGGITGDILTKNVGGKAQVEKQGSYSWKDFASTVNGKVTAVHGSIDKFKTETQKMAENFSRTDTAGKKNAIGQFADLLKDNKFLKTGLSAVPWLKSAIGLIDVFSGGGKSSAPQEVKLLPLSVNLTAKLNGTISTTNPYHDIIFTNPGSKDAALDPDIYPYYNEVMGIFNLLQTPTLYKQKNTAYREDYDGNTVRIDENRFKIDLSTIKYVLNPAADVTIQNMKAAILIEGTNRNYPACQYSPARVIPPDFTFEGKDALSGIEKFRSEYFDMNCLDQRILQANSFYNAIAGQNPVDGVGCPRVDNGAWIKFMINLKRNNATSTTQNILYVVTFPLTVVDYNITGNFTDNPSCFDSSIIAQASNTEVNNLCNSSVYFSIARQSRAYRDSVAVEAQIAKDGIGVFPNPNSGTFTYKIKMQEALLKRVFITDIQGRVVYTENHGGVNLNSGFTKLATLNLARGTYLLRGITNKGVLTTKVVVSK